MTVSHRFTNCVKPLGNGKYMARTKVLRGGEWKYAEKRFWAGTAEQNKEAARDWVNNWQRRRAGLSPSYHQPENLGELVELYLAEVAEDVKAVTLEGYTRLLSRLLSVFGPQHPLFFDQMEIQEYVRDRRHAGIGRGIIKELTCLRSAIHYYQGDTSWHIPKFLYRLPKQAAHIPTDMECRSMLASLSPNASLALLMAALAGLRDAEVYRMTWDCYAQSEGILRIPAEVRKTNSVNVVPVVTLLSDAFHACSESDSHCARLRHSRAIVDVSSSIVKQELKNVTGGKWYGLQPARRYLVTTLEDVGFHPDHIAYITGHSRKHMASRYSHGSEQLELKRRMLEHVEARLVA
jgi:integrase